MSMEAITGLIGTIVGACIAGYFVFHREKKQREHEQQKQKRELLLQKYEQIYKDLSNYSHFVGEISMQMISEVGYGGKFDPGKFTATLKDCDLAMNITFYAPEISEQLQDIEAQHTIAARAMTEFLLKSEASHEERSKFTGDAAVASAMLTKTVKEAQEKLASLAYEQTNA